MGYENISMDMERSQRIWKDLKGSGKISKDLERSQRIWKDLKGSGKISLDMEDLKISRDQQRDSYM